MPHGQIRAKAHRLHSHVLNQLRTLDAFRPAGKVLDQGGDGELAAGLVAFKHKWFQVGAGRIDGGGKTGAARAEDDSVADRVGHRFLCI